MSKLNRRGRAVPGATERGPALAPDQFAVEIASTGRVVEVGPGQTILEVVESAGVVVPNLCRGGFCGTCVTGVLAGAEHVLGSPIGGGGQQEISVCIARVRPGARIVLDI
ncbi:hypothetical protein BKG69_13110 [Mycobacteroides chelonae]|nr:hypothetical protein BKG69_13110 [Mycobacteroides chelonae]